VTSTTMGPPKTFGGETRLLLDFAEHSFNPTTITIYCSSLYTYQYSAVAGTGRLQLEGGLRVAPALPLAEAQSPAFTVTASETRLRTPLAVALACTAAVLLPVALAVP